MRFSTAHLTTMKRNLLPDSAGNEPKSPFSPRMPNHPETTPGRGSRLVVAVAAAGGLLVFGGSTLKAADAAPGVWYKGIVHAHANWGVPQLPTTSPDVVVRWYREHNYNFVSVTDLNYYTPPE